MWGSAFIVEYWTYRRPQLVVAEQPVTPSPHQQQIGTCQLVATQTACSESSATIGRTTRLHAVTQPRHRPGTACPPLPRLDAAVFLGGGGDSSGPTPPGLVPFLLHHHHRRHIREDRRAAPNDLFESRSSTDAATPGFSSRTCDSQVERKDSRFQTATRVLCGVIRRVWIRFRRPRPASTATSTKTDRHTSGVRQGRGCSVQPTSRRSTDAGSALRRRTSSRAAPTTPTTRKAAAEGAGPEAEMCAHAS